MSQSLNIKIINPRAEPQKGSGRKKPPFQALGLETLSVIEQAIKKNKKIAIFINRRGLATSIICQECGFVPKCPNCDIPLGFHLPAILICHHYGYQAPMPNTCPACQGYRLKPLGIGMQRISEELKKFISPLPQYALLEGQMLDNKELKIFDKFNQGKIKILIGTEALLRPQLESADVVIVASIDPLIFLPDYNSEERVFLYLLRLKKIAKEKLIIQTLIPENKIFQYLVNQEEEKFFEQEKKWRQNYFWPPFVQLIKLTLIHPDEKKGEKEALDIRNKIDQVILKTVPKNLQENFIVLGPAPAFIFKEKKVYRWNILIKYKYITSKILQNTNSLSGLNSLMPLLTKEELNLRNKVLKTISLNKYWRVDVDPKDTL